MFETFQHLFIKRCYAIVILPALFFIALSLRMLNANKEFSGDETILLSISQHNFDQIIPILKQKEVYPPLTYILVHYWAHLNNSLLWIRMYFVLFGMGVCFVIYLIAKEYMDIKLARISFLFAVFSPLLIFISQYARSYGDSSLWMLLSTLFMLKIINGKNKFVNWLAYTMSIALSLYTFYFSSLLIFAQFIFATIFKWKDKKFMLKWYLAICAAGLIFLPWGPSALGQFKNASSIAYDWSDKGVNFGIFRLGLYTRNIFSVIGFDPYFMVFEGGISSHFSKIILVISVIASFSALFFFLYYCFKWLKSKFPENSALVWFFPFLAFIPLIISWLCAWLFNTLPIPKYLAAFHSFFLILLSIFVCALWEKKKITCILFIVFILGIFAARIPSAVSVEIEGEKATFFLKENLMQDDCLIMLDSGPRKEGLISRTVGLGKFLKLNEKGTAYEITSAEIWNELKQNLQHCRRIWFYKAYGNIEIFGGNRIVERWMKNEEYRVKEVNKFKNIDIIEYER